MNRKVFCLSVGIAIMAVLIGCSGDDQKGTVVKTDTGNFNEFGWEIPEETLVVNVLVASGNDAPSEALKQGRENTIEFYKENFNVELDIEYVTGDGTETLNLALVTNDYPDIITSMSFDMMQQFTAMEKAQDLTPYMDTIGKDIKSSMGDLYPLFLNDEMKLTYVPRSMGGLAELPDNTAHIRFDEYTAIGSPVIETPEDYYNAMNAILEINPTTPNGETRYAMSLYDDDSAPEIFAGFWGLKKGYKIDENNDFTHWAFTDEGKEMTKFFNQFHLDGTLDPDAFANDFEQWKTKFSNERVVGAIGGWWISYNAGHEVWQSIDPNTPEDKRYFQVGFKDEDAEAAYLSPKNNLGSQCTIITDKATDVEALLKFINFQATDLGKALVGWGIPNGTPIGNTGEEGKTWNIDKEGNWEIDSKAKEAFITETWSYDNEGYFQGSPWLFINTTRWDDGVHCVWGNQMWYEENKWKTLMIDNLEGTIYDASALTLRTKDVELKILEQSIEDAWKLNWGNVVTADTTEEFDSSWKALQDALTAAGIEKYEEALKANYENNVEKLDS